MTEQAPAADLVTAAIAATVGSGIDEATAERIARLARYLLDGDPALSMRLGPYKLDAPRAAVKAAVTAAALAIAIEGAGLDSVPVVVLACVVPFLVEIERVELTPGDELVVAALRATAPVTSRSWTAAPTTVLRRCFTSATTKAANMRCSIARRETCAACSGSARRSPTWRFGGCSR